MPISDEEQAILKTHERDQELSAKISTAVRSLNTLLAEAYRDRVVVELSVREGPRTVGNPMSSVQLELRGVLKRML